MATELREAGYGVVGIGRDVPADGGTNNLHCDLCDRGALVEAVTRVNPDVVVHLAGIAFIPQDDVESLYRTHVIGTRNLLEALARCVRPPRSILLVSSANVYGNAASGVLDETVTALPSNDYAVSKLAMEHMAMLWRERLPITIVRPFNYTGVGQSEDFLIPKIVRHFRRRSPVIELGNLDVIRDYSDVRVVVKCYRLLLESTHASGEVFNVCSGVGHALKDLLAAMRELSGHSPEIRVNPAFVRPNEVRKLIGSRRKLETCIGTVADIPLRETLHWMFEAAAG